VLTSRQPDNTTQAYRKLAGVVTLQDVVETRVVDSAGEICWNNTFAQQETFGANDDDVYVWEHTSLLLVNSAVD